MAITKSVAGVRSLLVTKLLSLLVMKQVEFSLERHRAYKHTSRTNVPVVKAALVLHVGYVGASTAVSSISVN